MSTQRRTGRGTLVQMDGLQFNCAWLPIGLLEGPAEKALADWAAEGGALGPPAEARADDEPAELLEPIIAYASPAAAGDGRQL